MTIFIFIYLFQVKMGIKELMVTVILIKFTIIDHKILKILKPYQMNFKKLKKMPYFLPELLT